MGKLLVLTFMFINISCSNSNDDSKESASDFHKKDFDVGNQYALGAGPTQNPMNPSPLPTGPSQPTPSPFLPANSCQNIKDAANQLFNRALGVCRTCSDLWVLCERCLYPTIAGNNNDGLSQTLCLTTCRAESACFEDLGNTYTFPLRDLNAQYINAGCLQPGENTIGNLPVYSPCTPQPSPSPLPPPPPPSAEPSLPPTISPPPTFIPITPSPNPTVRPSTPPVTVPPSPNPTVRPSTTPTMPQMSPNPTARPFMSPLPTGYR